MAIRPLDKELFEEPYEFEFFQAVRLLERLTPDKQPVGDKALPNEETVRFRSRVAMDFPSSEIHEIAETDGDDEPNRTEMYINFMGLIGPNGALPVHYTELVLDRIRRRDTAMWAFFDIFTHRCVSLFFRAWAKYRFPVGYERGNDEFTSYLFDLCGLGTKGLRGRMDLEDESLLPYTGLIAQRPHSTNAVENVISDYFGIGASVEQFFGQWLELDQSDQTQIGVARSVLGTNIVVGSRVWDQQSKFRLRLGPLTFKHFQAFLPIGTAYAALRSIVRFMVGPELDFDMQLDLRKEEVPATILTTRALRRPMLGWTSFLRSRPAVQNDDQLVLQFAA
jgi:type VI secretion system protein ImpH